MPAGQVSEGVERMGQVQGSLVLTPGPTVLLKPSTAVPWSQGESVLNFLSFYLTQFLSLNYLFSFFSNPVNYSAFFQGPAQ